MNNERNEVLAMKQKTPLIHKLIFYILIAFLLGPVLTIPCRAEVATTSEARFAATNWINLIIHKRGDWGGSASATVKDIKPLKRDERKLGYFCQVEPQGYIVLSLLKELSPVTDFSWESNLDPDNDEGMADLIKDCIERNLDAIEKQAGPIEKVTTEQLQRIIPIPRNESWQNLTVEPADFEESLGSIEPLANYQEGQEMLTSRWHQWYPYNMWCPTPPTGSGCTENNCTVGCVGLSACEIMRYWNWPPYGTVAPYNNPPYAWWNMPDKAYSNSPISEKVAVAELCSEVADAILSDYCIAGGCATSSNFTRVKNAIESYFRYGTASPELFRVNYTNETWFNLIKGQLNINRPVQYSYPGHAIVADGWLEVGTGPLRYLHLCYGFASEDNTAWHLVEAIPGGGETTDVIMIDIYPAPSLGPSLSGVYYVPSFPYRYFDRDCSSSYAVFRPGHKLQFLPNIVVRSNGTIEFEGSGTSESRLFTRGDTSNGIRLNNGGISLYNKGNLRLY
jgi:hypothetical protein